MIAIVEVRTQHAKVSRHNPYQHGPDMYVAVQIVPRGVKPLRSLNHAAAERRGIVIEYFGEGYSSRTKTPRSMLSKALRAAEEFAASVNTPWSKL